MKKFILATLFLMSCATTYKQHSFNYPVSSAYSTSYSDLNETETNRVMQKLDEECGDLWCRGGWVYHFYRSGRLTCTFNTGKCILTAKVYTDTIRSTFRSCEIREIWKYRQMMNGGHLDPEFADKVVDCIEIWEINGIRSRVD